MSRKHKTPNPPAAGPGASAPPLLPTLMAAAQRPPAPAVAAPAEFSEGAVSTLTPLTPGADVNVRYIEPEQQAIPAKLRPVRVGLPHSPSWEGEAADDEDAIDRMCAAYGIRRRETDHPFTVQWPEPPAPSE